MWTELKCQSQKVTAADGSSNTNKGEGTVAEVPTGRRSLEEAEAVLCVLGFAEQPTALMEAVTLSLKKSEQVAHY